MKRERKRNAFVKNDMYKLHNNLSVKRDGMLNKFDLRVCVCERYILVEGLRMRMIHNLLNTRIA